VDPVIELLRAQLAARTPVDGREAASIAEVLAGLDALARPFDEHAGPTHVTASAIVVGARGVVLHRHKRLGIWLQPGGHVDPGELPWHAARREATEETGLDVELAATGGEAAPELVHVDAHPGPRGHRHLDLRYLLVAGDADPSPPAGESPDVRWFGWDEALAIADAGLAGALRHLRPG